MTSTALAKKKEQDEAKAAQLAHLQAEQALQAETASANYTENQQKQAQATTNVVMAGKQSQANKNFWYAYALWQQKVAQALARRRAEALARKRAEAEARARQAQSSSQARTVNPYPLALFLAVVVFGAGALLGTVQTKSSKDTSDFHKETVEESQAATRTCYELTRAIPGPFDDMLCPAISVFENFDDIGRLADDIADLVVGIIGGGTSASTQANALQNMNPVVDDFNEAYLNVQARQEAIAMARWYTHLVVELVKQQDAPMPSKHMALGLMGDLVDFTINMNLLLNPYGITVHSWVSASPPDEEVINALGNFYVLVGEPPILSPVNFVPAWNQTITNETRFSNQFWDVANKVSVIHFNLEGIGFAPYSNVIEWARKAGREIIPGDAIISGFTANELLTISLHPELCAKTIFYSTGGRVPLNPIPQMDPEAKLIICGGN